MMSKLNVIMFNRLDFDIILPYFHELDCIKKLPNFTAYLLSD